MKKLYIAALLGLCISTQVKAQITCPYEAYGTPTSIMPTTEQKALPIQTDVRVCDEGYAWGFSKKTNVNVYSAELLTKEQVQKAKEMRRYGTFDNRDPLIRDYRNSGYDRGHMAPSGDMGSYESQVKTFIPQNLVPQTRQLNSGKWNWIENQTRQMAIQYGSVYVVTGPYFQGNTKKIGDDRLWVPYATWKAIYVPKLEQTGVYFCRNTQKPICYIQTVEFFTQKTGIDPFPKLDASIKAAQLPLPKMGEYKKQQKKHYQRKDWQ
ncbi:DNA/RNA non-specific endonuclease [Commensalibacter papalotli (ex Botero et al. 2024)]|uniref:Endonuclease n=1 Tax=Commensalibacter papalotli (ex Botero et al. 2024) TaxID=2972766 RepID=A0ABM9HNY5_9PROT|nr:DNA/RNA non-specific endonuclease [Commensalibacter papalotli (ex Botero et al. 2024)]CAI3934294.1 DNA/RNA endonuclease G [Commensalibacter papalotli (ex Botero et al. 2024)]CAI3941413.1 DNA/RNA endonuclease G [Commensalibacter papalotli (ex Botero et al. 2024)]